MSLLTAFRARAYTSYLFIFRIWRRRVRCGGMMLVARPGRWPVVPSLPGWDRLLGSAAVVPRVGFCSPTRHTEGHDSPQGPASAPDAEPLLVCSLPPPP